MLKKVILDAEGVLLHIGEMEDEIVNDNGWIATEIEMVEMNGVWVLPDQNNLSNLTIENLLYKIDKLQTEKDELKAENDALVETVEMILVDVLPSIMS